MKIHTAEQLAARQAAQRQALEARIAKRPKLAPAAAEAKRDKLEARQLHQQTKWTKRHPPADPGPPPAADAATPGQPDAAGVPAGNLEPPRVVRAGWDDMPDGGGFAGGGGPGLELTDGGADKAEAAAAAAGSSWKTSTKWKVGLAVGGLVTVYLGWQYVKHASGYTTIKRGVGLVDQLGKLLGGK